LSTIFLGNIYKLYWWHFTLFKSVNKPYKVFRVHAELNCLDSVLVYLSKSDAAFFCHTFFFSFFNLWCFFIVFSFSLHVHSISCCCWERNTDRERNIKDGRKKELRKKEKESIAIEHKVKVRKIWIQNIFREWKNITCNWKKDKCQNRDYRNKRERLLGRNNLCKRNLRTEYERLRERVRA
jgi:hypothetical protein